MSKVLVTGGAGFIGSNTCDLLLEKGYEVAVVDDLSTGKRENLNPEASFNEADVTSKALDKVFEKEKPNYVIHLAAQIDVRKSIKEPEKDAKTNIFGMINVLRSCVEHNVKKVVYGSTGGALYGEPKYMPVDEKHPVTPLSPYGASKYAAEKYLQIYSFNHGLGYNILRYSNVYGPRQDPLGEAGVVAIFTNLINDGKNPRIFGDGKQTRDFCYVGDVSQANLIGLEREGDSKIYNIGSGIETSVNKISDELAEAVGVEIRPIHDPPIDGEVRNICLDVDLAGKELGWEPETELRDGLAKTIEWVRTR